MSNPMLLKMLSSMIPKDAFKNVNIEVEWQEEENGLLIFIKITKKEGGKNEAENKPL